MRELEGTRKGSQTGPRRGKVLMVADLAESGI